MSIPYHLSDIDQTDYLYIKEMLDNNQLGTLGKYSQLCQEWLVEQTGARKALLTHSCSAALEMSAILADIQPGDEVIMPSFTFVSTANAVVLRGGVPVFVDIRPDTLNLDETKIAQAITERTRAIMPVHYAAVSCEMDTITTIAEQHQLMVIEDAAQSLGARYRDQAAGTQGDLGCFSFHNTKNITSGQGGALLINNEQLAARAQILLEKGTNRAEFLQGLVDKYTWVDIGSSYTMSELNAALLWSQLQKSEQITLARRRIWQRYYEGLSDLASEGVIGLPHVPEHCQHNAHIFYLLLPDAGLRNGFMQALREQDIHSVFHYVPLHLAPAGQRFARTGGDLSTTESLSQRLVRLPLYSSMSEAEVDQVIEAVRSVVVTTCSA